MSFAIKNIRINSVYGSHTYNIPIKNNRLILVGENGSGKTTIINAIFLFLSGQLKRLSRLEFASITIATNDEEYVLSHEEVVDYCKTTNEGKNRSGLPIRYKVRVDDYIKENGVDDVLHNEKKLRELSSRFRIPSHILRDYLVNTYDDSSGILKINSKIDKLKNEIGAQVLFLPTYRRIEQELEAVLSRLHISHEDVENRYVNYHDLIYEREEKNDYVEHTYIELVKFGMEDVVNQINRTMGNLKEYLRKELNNLTATYLKEVLSGKYKDIKYSQLQGLKNEAMEKILGRIDENMLSNEEKHNLRDFVSQIHASESLNTDQQITAHFLMKLSHLQQLQKAKEKKIINFVNICNKYLNNKEIRYDNVNFTTSITPTEELKRDQIPFRSLSSGEKQIVSLFSHIILSDIQKFFILIDEPELSLSVKWQKSFLVDILRTGKCSGLFAVTHSPFIFDNELDEYSQSLDNLLEE